MVLGITNAFFGDFPAILYVSDVVLFIFSAIFRLSEHFYFKILNFYDE